MSQTDLFGAYVRNRLDLWGQEFALHRDCEYLGHQSVNLLQVLIDHKGEIPARATGFKPLEVSAEAMQIEDIVSDIARYQVALACAMRAYYCGIGRRKVERWETANLLIAHAGERVVSQRQYLVLCDLAFERVRGRLEGVSQAA